MIRQFGLREATVRINNPEICESCAGYLPRILPADAKLPVVLPDNTSVSFVGAAK
jgi:hypothetical protein